MDQLFLISIFQGVLAGPNALLHASPLGRNFYMKTMMIPPPQAISPGKMWGDMTLRRTDENSPRHCCFGIPRRASGAFPKIPRLRLKSLHGNKKGFVAKEDKPKLPVGQRTDMSDALGISAEQFWRLRGPKSQRAVEGRMKFFRNELNLSNPEIGRMALKFNRLLEYHPRRTEKNIRLFENLGMELDKIRQVACRTPSLLYYSESSIRSKIQLMQNLLGMEPDEVLGVLSKNAKLLTLSNCHLKEQIVWLNQGLGMTQQEARSVVSRHPPLLSYRIDSMMNHVEVLNEVFSLAGTIDIIRRLPQIMSFNINRNLRPTLRYLLTEVGISRESIVSTPAILSLSLDGRITPRHEAIREAGFLPKVEDFIVKESVFEDNLEKKQFEEHMGVTRKPRARSVLSRAPSIVDEVSRRPGSLDVRLTGKDKIDPEVRSMVDDIAEGLGSPDFIETRKDRARPVGHSVKHRPSTTSGSPSDKLANEFAYTVFEKMLHKKDMTETDPILDEIDKKDMKKHSVFDEIGTWSPSPKNKARPEKHSVLDDIGTWTPRESVEEHSPPTDMDIAHKQGHVHSMAAAASASADSVKIPRKPPLPGLRLRSKTLTSLRAKAGTPIS